MRGFTIAETDRADNSNALIDGFWSFLNAENAERPVGNTIFFLIAVVRSLICLLSTLHEVSLAYALP